MKNRSCHHVNPLNIPDVQRQISDGKIRIALLQAALIEDRADALSSLDIVEENETPQVSPVDQRILSAIDHCCKKMNRKKCLSGIPKLMKAVAALLLISFIATGTAMAVSAEFRVMVMKLLYTVTPQYTEIRLVKDKASASVVPKDWAGNYYPLQIPKGYELYETQENGDILMSIYRNKENKMLHFNESGSTTEINIDTEGYEIKDISLNDSKAVLAYKDGKSKIVWHVADKILMLTIEEEPQTAIDIAQSVVQVK